MNRPVYYTKVRVKNWEGGAASVMLERHVINRPPVSLGGRVGIVLQRMSKNTGSSQELMALMKALREAEDSLAGEKRVREREAKENRVLTREVDRLKQVIAAPVLLFKVFCGCIALVASSSIPN